MDDNQRMWEDRYASGESSPDGAQPHPEVAALLDRADRQPADGPPRASRNLFRVASSTVWAFEMERASSRTAGTDAPARAASAIRTPPSWCGIISVR